MKPSLFICLLSSCLLFSSCLATTKPIGASLKSTDFDSSFSKEITLLHEDIYVEKEGYLGRDKADKNATESIISKFEQKLDSLFLIEEINLIVEPDSFYKHSKLDEFLSDIQSLNKNYLSDNKRKEGIINQHPDFDLSNSDNEITTDLGIYLSIKGSENTSYFDSGYGSSAIKTEYTTVVSYLFDIKKNKLVWIYEYAEKSNIEKVNLDAFIKSVLFSLKYDRDLKPKSFEIEPSGKQVLLTKNDGFQLFGNIEKVSNFEISFKNSEGVSIIHMKDIGKIEIPSERKTLFPFEI